MRFGFATASRILFGPGDDQRSRRGRPGLPARPRAGRDRESARHAIPLLRAVEDAGLTAVCSRWTVNPAFEMAVAGLEQARAEGCDLVIGWAAAARWMPASHRRAAGESR